MLRDDINNAVKEAMKAKDERKLSTLRMVNSTIKNADIEARGNGKPPLSDADLLGVFQKMIKQRQESVELYDKGGRAELAAQEREEMFPELVHPLRRDDSGIRRLVDEQGEDVGVEGYLRQQTAIIARVDSRPTLATIKCPTLVLTGDQDNTIPNAFSKEMAEGIAGARLVILDRCGHLPQPEQPEATARALVEWLQTQVVSGARTA